MKRRKNTGNRRLSLAASLFAVIIAVVMMTFLPGYFEDDVQDSSLGYLDYPFCVTFFDVGQGDGALISCDGYNILVDGGEWENSSTITRFLKEENIEKIDAYILSHPHSDHIGAAPEIIESIECDKIFTTYFSEFNIPTTNVYEKVIDAIYEYDVEAVIVEAGDSFTFGELEIDIVAPMVESDDYNAMSIVFTATYKDTTVLFTGDTTRAVERQILENDYDVDADFLKVAHHGSVTSSLPEFIDAVSPDYALFSCGVNNSYGHPHLEIKSIFSERDIATYQTSYNGTVFYFGDGYDMSVETSK